MGRRGIALLAVLCVAAGCGSPTAHSTKLQSGVPVRPEYTQQQIKAAFAAQGIPLRKMVASHHLVVLVDSQWDGPFGYQRAGDDKQSSVTRFLVFVRAGPHSTQRGNVWVAYNDPEGPVVRAALRKLSADRR